MAVTETGMPSQVTGPRAPEWRLHVVFSPRRQLESVLALGDATVGVGREPGALPALTLDDSQISRRHLELRPLADGWELVDLESRNGTFVDGQRAARVALRGGEVIRLGRSLLVCSRGVGPSAVAPGRSLLVGRSQALARVRADLAAIAPHDAAVLVLGETGTGKELVARELHERSGRGGAFVAVNCAAIAATVAESELFGHVGGAFTGASVASEGVFGAAHGGTLFLDEIGDLLPELQAKLLRALSVGEVRPVGSSRPRRVDVRVIAATHRDLAGAVQTGAFRADLYARLAGSVIQLPPLRERREDILELAALFLGRSAKATQLSASAAEALLLHDWPFNVRELEQAISAAVPHLDGGVLRPAQLPAAVRDRLAHRTDGSPSPEPEATPAASDTPPEAELRAALAHHAGSIRRVAEHFGKDRKQVYRWMERYGLDADEFRR